ncbi:hypothetical protein JCM14467A_10090 [Vulcanisaeta sp. JCM 14467]
MSWFMQYLKMVSIMLSRMMYSGGAMLLHLISFLYEHLWVLAKLTGSLEVIKVKLNELRDFPILHEDLNTIYNGLTLIGQGKA